MVTVTIVCIIMTIMAYGVMLMLNRQIEELHAEINQMYSKQTKAESRIENCEKILLDTAKRAHRHDQQYANMIAKVKATEHAIEQMKGY